MHEEATFRCRWKRTPAGYALWIPGYASAKLEATDLTAGAEAMSELLLKLGVSTAASLELTPRPPVAEAVRRFTQPELYLIIGDEPCYCRSVDSYTLLTGIRCNRCHCINGIRNDKQLALDCLVSGDGGFTYDQGHTYRFFSGEFIEQLSDSERAHLEFREIRTRGRRSFFELIGPPGIPTVAVAGLQLSGWFCPDCKRRTFSYFVKVIPIGHFVARSSLPAPPSTLFTVSDGHVLGLCATACRWDELREMRRSRGILSHLLGVANPADLVEPTLPEYDEAKKVHT